MDRKKLIGLLINGGLMARTELTNFTATNAIFEYVADHTNSVQRFYRARLVSLGVVLSKRIMPEVQGGGGGGVLVVVELGASGKSSFNVRSGWKGRSMIFGVKKRGSVFGWLREPVTLYSKSFATGQKTVLIRGPTTQTSRKSSASTRALTWP